MLKPLAKSALLAMACSLAMATVNAADVAKIDVPAGNLAEALTILSKQANVDLVYQARHIERFQTRGVRGQLTVREAVQKLLEGTPLLMSTDESSGAMMIVDPDKTGATSSAPGYIDEVMVHGRTITDPILSSRTGETVKDRPQSVSVVTREQMEEQNLNSVASVLEQTTGVTVVNQSNTNSFIYSRGFAIDSFQIDGGSPIRVNIGYSQMADMAMYEQVEVVRGADALFSGNGEPGGTVHLVRKRPTAEPQVSVSASLGRWDNYRGELDAAGPIAWDGRIRGRVVYMQEKSRSFQESIGDSRDRSLVYGVLEADLTPTTLLAVGGNYDNSHAPYAGFGLPRFGDGSDLGLSRGVVFTADWSKLDSTGASAFARLEQQLGDRWSLRLNTMRDRRDTDYNFLVSFSAVNPVTSAINMIGASGINRSVQDVADITLRGSFDLWGGTHRVAIGADWLDNNIRAPSWFLDDQPANAFAFNPSAFADPGRTAFPQRNDSFGQKQNGIYANISLQVLQPMRLLAGARYSNFESWNDGRALGVGGETLSLTLRRSQERNVVTPYFGLTYELPSSWVAYGNYSEVFQSQSSSLSGPLPGRPLDPMTGEMLEFGIKGDLGRGRAATQMSVYQIERVNQAVLDSSYAPGAGALGSSCCYLAQGVIESRGADLEISGRLHNRWNLIGGYTYNENEYKSGYRTDLGTSYMPRTPAHLFKLWSTYQFAGALDGLKVGGGLNAQSRTSVVGSLATYDPVTGAVQTSTPYRFHQDPYATVSLRGEYSFNDTWSVALNLTNLFDRTYYRTLGDTRRGNWYGEPRSFVVSLKGTW
ncbi:TonB-dependent siderophore receptor [Steroidobacter sp.]|uniref:TonB-dependent siderophore receptor n=1 Tax=Steroidobacter sp. TaxID=1978227 RepID=UPI001A3876FF|nr:TonB-dependent siderophore receptor [Steroidobacter sp.]MBL8265175.1 TonB-dependent siderophore receptor [Steroidobacter sp.]